MYLSTYLQFHLPRTSLGFPCWKLVGNSGLLLDQTKEFKFFFFFASDEKIKMEMDSWFGLAMLVPYQTIVVKKVAELQGQALDLLVCLRCGPHLRS